jgi:hypothetical protein
VEDSREPGPRGRKQTPPPLSTTEDQQPQRAAYGESLFKVYECQTLYGKSGKLEADSSDNMANEYISVSEALKLVSPFSGDKKELLAFISNVDTAFEVVNPNYSGRLYNFVLTRISEEPRIAITHRHLKSWTELKEFLKNTYIEKQTLDFHTNTLYKAKQEKTESVSNWIQKIQGLGSKFREAAITDCTDEERQGLLTLSDRLRNICFVQGLSSDRIQTIVLSRN